jgi:hypothetical protein
MKIVLPKKKSEPVKPTWPFPTQPPVPERVHVPPKPNPDNYEDSLL